MDFDGFFTRLNPLILGVLRSPLPEFLERAENTIRRVPGMDRQFGISFDRRIGLTDAQAETLRREIAAVEIALDPG